ncbi:MAG: type IV pili twitching motility protein PilT [Deltaproteobacteria bacterium]|nr:MAG: type IV pili twitching motility protein PilT [Deltaproteobacteria bacterium]
MASLHELLKVMIDSGASDLHLTVASPPQIRIDGTLKPLDLPALNANETKQMCYSVLTDSQKHRFEKENELDLSFGLKGVSRFRANIFIQRGTVAGAFRAIPYEVRPFNELGLPAIVQELMRKPSGLILVTGPTGSGKSTTLASMIDQVNEERHEHIITIEDPIEFIHTHKNCIVNQREVKADTEDFSKALRYILRQDPDVVLVGELRDLETVASSLTVAETGHLTLATLHTNSCAQTINRVIDIFPSHQQPQIRSQLSFVLQAVISQQLIPHRSGHGRVLAIELMVPNAAIRNLIREDKIHQIYSQMQVGQSRFSMQTMNQSLATLYQGGKISLDDAFSKSNDLMELKQMLGHAI